MKSETLRLGTLCAAWLVLGLLVLPALLVPRLLVLPALLVPRLLADSSPMITGADPERAVPDIPPHWIRIVRGRVAVAVIAIYPLAWVTAVVWMRGLRQRGRYAASLLPIGLPVLAASPLVAILAADRYREITASAVIRDIATDGSHAWVTASSENERNAWLATLELAASGEPREVGAVPLKHFGWVHSEARRERWNILDVTGRAAVLADLGGGIFVLDLKSGEQTGLEGSYFDAAALSYPDRLLVATSEGLVVHDLTAPSSLRVLARVPQDGVDPQRVLSVKGARALVKSGKQEIWVYDFDDPAHPRRRGKWVAERFPGLWFSEDMAVAGPLVLALSNSTLLHVIDFSDPDHPAEVGRLTFSEPVHRLSASGTVAAVATVSEPAAVLLIDLSRPRNPTLAAREHPSLEYFAPYPAFAVSGTRMLLAFGNVVQVLDVSNPSIPRPLGQLQLRGY